MWSSTVQPVIDKHDGVVDILPLIYVCIAAVWFYGCGAASEMKPRTGISPAESLRGT